MFVKVFQALFNIYFTRAHIPNIGLVFLLIITGWPERNYNLKKSCIIVLLIDLLRIHFFLQIIFLYQFKHIYITLDDSKNLISVLVFLNLDLYKFKMQNVKIRSMKEYFCYRYTECKDPPQF